jgi:hypothetical protein
MRFDPERLERLKTWKAALGYFLAAWSLAGQWSRSEFVLRKANAITDSGYGRLALFAAGVGWLAYLLIRAPRPAEERLAKVKRLLREAREGFRGEKRVNELRGDWDAVHHIAYRGVVFGRFLDQAFRHHVSIDHNQYLADEKAKWDRAGATFDASLAEVDYIGGVLERVGLQDLDYGFHMPDSYEHYAKSDTWIANRRPEPKP